MHMICRWFNIVAHDLQIPQWWKQHAETTREGGPPWKITCDLEYWLELTHIDISRNTYTITHHAALQPTETLWFVYQKSTHPDPIRICRVGPCAETAPCELPVRSFEVVHGNQFVALSWFCVLPLNFLMDLKSKTLNLLVSGDFSDRIELQHHIDTGVSLNGGTPISHTTKWSFLVGKPMGLLGKPTILGNPHTSKSWFFTEKLKWSNSPVFH